MTNFWVKSTIISSVLAKKNLYVKNKIIYNFMIFVATNNRTKQIFPSSLLVPLLDPGLTSRIRKTAFKKRLPGTVI
jgi:hypothetical protein